MIYLGVFAISCMLLRLSEKIEKYENQKFYHSGGRRKQKLCFYLLVVLALFIPALLAGLRDSSIGTDVKLYGNSWFKYTQLFGFVEYLKFANRSSIGLTYAFLNYIVSIVTDNLKIFYFVLSFIETALVYLGLREFKEKISVSFAMFCYYTLFYNNTLNLLRQFLAVSIVFFAYTFLIRENYIKFSILIILATLSHSSAIFAILLLPIYIIIKHLDKKKDVFIFEMVLFAIVAIVMIFYKNVLSFLISHGILSSRYLTYMDETIVGGRLIRIVFWFAIVVIAYFAFNKMIKYYNANRFFISCITMSLAFSLVLFMGNVYAIRMAFYFDVASIVFIPIIPKVYKTDSNNKMSRYFIYIILIFILILRWYLEYVRSLNGATYPYKFADF